MTMDAKEISQKFDKAKAAVANWASEAKDRMAAVGQNIVSSRDQVRTASAPERKSPFQNNQLEAVTRLDRGAAAGGSRDLKKIAQQSRDLQINNTVAQAQKMIEKKLAKMPVMSPNIMYLKSDISRWDEESGKPQTGRISFQIPFSAPHGDPRTIYASVDIVLGDLMEPRYFSDGLNHHYAFDATGVGEMLKGTEFELVQTPHTVPQPKYMGPEFHAPDGVPGAVAAVDSPMIHVAKVMTKQAASGPKPAIARESFVRAISKEANLPAPPITPQQVAELKKDKEQIRKPSHALSIYPSGSESNTGYVGENHGGDQIPAASTLASKALAEVRELNWDGSIRSQARVQDVSAALDLAHQVTYGGHDFVVEVYNDGKLVERIAGVRTGSASANFRFREAAFSLRLAQSAMKRVIEDLQLLDMRMISFRDVVQLLKQHGQMKDVAFDSAAKELANAGIVLYQNASTKADNSLARRVAVMHARTIIAQPADAPVQESPSTPEMPGAGSPDQPAEQSAPQGNIAPPADMDSVEFREFERLKDQLNNEWATIRERENNNINNGLAPETGIDYTNLQLIYDKIRSMQESVQGRKTQEISQDKPSDLAMQQKTKPAEVPAPTASPEGAGPEAATLLPQKGQGLAGQAPAMTRAAIAQALDMGTTIKVADDLGMEKGHQEAEKPYDEVSAIMAFENGELDEEGTLELFQHLVDTGLAWRLQGSYGRAAASLLEQGLIQPAEKDQSDAYGNTVPGAPRGKRAALEPDPELAAKTTERGKDPSNPKDLEETEQMYKDPTKTPMPLASIRTMVMKEAAHSLKHPEVCKNCKNLMVPAGYSVLKEYKHTRLPFCGAAKGPGVGFRQAYFRECAGYDPIVKDIPQKIESKAPESQQTKEDLKKIEVPIYQKADALPSPNGDALKNDSPGHTGYGLDIRRWCQDGGHYAHAGEVHPTHDWCTLWNTAVENLVMLPSGAVVPKSVAGQSSESHGEGGPHQFGDTPNQTA
jgi:hypothetical protein